MADAMTLEEAVAAWKLSGKKSVAVNLGAIMQTFAAHAERTLQEREGEPDIVRKMRETCERYPSAKPWPEILAVLDTLTAENAALRAERDALRAEVAERISDIQRIIAPVEVGGGIEAFLAERDALQARLDAAQKQCQDWANAAYKSATLGCCGKAGLECCGEPVPCWSAESEAVMLLCTDMLRILEGRTE